MTMRSVARDRGLVCNLRGGFRCPQPTFKRHPSRGTLPYSFWHQNGVCHTGRCVALLFALIVFTCVGTKEAYPLARSLFCQSFHYLPFEDGFGRTSIPFINRLCDQLSIDWVIPSDAHTTRFLTENKAALGPKSYPVPDTATFELLNDKSAFIGLCQNLDIPTPQTEVLPNKQQLLDRI